MKAMMTGVALAALIAGTPALAAETWQQLAQADQQPAQSQEMQAAPACPEGQTCPPDATAGAADQPETAADAADQPATTGSVPAQPDATDTAKSDASQGATEEMVAKPAGKFFDEQDDNAILASELIGKTVYDASDTSLGDINDVVWTKDGTIEGVIVGVGGFLGIGEKNVAVDYDALTVTADENGDKKLVLDATADELAAAPEFKTTAEKVAELRAQQAPSDMGAGNTAPPPLAPAPAQTQ